MIKVLSYIKRSPSFSKVETEEEIGIAVLMKAWFNFNPGIDK